MISQSWLAAAPVACHTLSLLACRSLLLRCAWVSLPMRSRSSNVPAIARHLPRFLWTAAEQISAKAIAAAATVAATAAAVRAGLVAAVPAVALRVPAVVEATVRLARRGRRRMLWPPSVASLQARPAPALPQVVQHLEATQMARSRRTWRRGRGWRLVVVQLRGGLVSRAGESSRLPVEAHLFPPRSLQEHGGLHDRGVQGGFAGRPLPLTCALSNGVSA